MTISDGKMKPKCCVCAKHIYSKGHARKILEQHKAYYRVRGQLLTNSAYICNKCRQKCYKNSTALHSDNVVPPPEVSNVSENENTITLPIISVGKTSRKCCVCKTTNGPFVALPEMARLHLFVQKGLLAPAGIRVCPIHLDGKTLKVGSEIDKSKLRNTTSKCNASDLMWLLDRLRTMVSDSKKKRLDFDDPNSLSDEDISNLTGITKDQFSFLVSSVTSLKKSCNRTPRTAIAILLVKLKTGLSHRLLATLFGIGSRRTVSKIVQQAKKALTVDFVPSYIGFQHISREEIVEKHTSNFATQLFSNFLSDSVICIMDGTYIYIQKSSKYKFQRRCFSMHKHRPLIKPMVVTSTDGYIISVLGPYLADGKNNDASIVQHMMKSNEENMMKWFRKQDILILDRGFRDALNFLHDTGFQTESPAFLSKTEKQFSAKEANMSRLVTKIRWAVESVNGRIKCWKYFDKVVPNIDILNVKEYLRIVSALCNKFKPPLITSTEADCEIAHSMLQRAKLPNTLQDRVLKDKDFGKKARKWMALEESKHYDNFPKLSEDYLRSITFGIYQLNQAPKYTDQHLLDGDMNIYLHLISSTTLQAKLQSRHTSCKQYYLWLEYAEDDEINPVRCWYSECKSGARTVGCCAHIAAVLWYMGYARHVDYKPKPDNFSSSFQDASCEVDTETDLDSE